MSMRRSARTQAKAALETNVPSGPSAEHSNTGKKRVRKSQGSEDSLASARTASKAKTKSQPSNSMPPPTTPNKRRRTAQSNVHPAPLTPTPTAVGLMTSTSNLQPNYSSGDIDDTTPPPPPIRPVEPHHTNATLVTPGGTQVQSNYDNLNGTPSRPSARPLTTTATLLEDACAHLIKVDPSLRTLVEKNHCHVFSPRGLAEEIDPFRSLVSGICGQQVSGAAAKSIKNKFIALYPPESCPRGFPPPALVSKTPLPELRTAGLSQRKAEYIQGLAEKFDTGELSVKMLMEGSDQEVMEKLVAVRGLGMWSVEMFMCFGLKRMDILSTGDLGVQRGMAAYVGRDVKKLKAKGGGKWKYMSEQDMLDISAKFAPYRSLFMWYMWRIEDVDVDVMQGDATNE